MAFMELQVMQRGRLASVECSKCGIDIFWHEMVNEGQAEDLKSARCPDCGGKTDPETLWVSRSRNWYAGRYSAPGYLDCTDWHYSKNERKLIKELKDAYDEFS